MSAEYVYTVGLVNRDGSIHAEDEHLVTEDREEAGEWVEDALASGTFSNAILVRRPKVVWEAVSDD